MHHPPFSKVWTLFLKKCVNLQQEVFYPGSGLLAYQGADKGIPINDINDLNLGTSSSTALTTSTQVRHTHAPLQQI
jgi:hypothetical protein